MPFDVVVHVGRSKNVFYNVVQGVGAHEAFGRSWVDEDAMHLSALYEMESVETVLGVINKVCVVLLGVGVDVVVRRLFVGYGLRLRA